ncbi:CBS domain-containing protein [Methylobacterium oxalidis]|uniref:Inosine-5-monophosphate dehydrogenase n=1 Tax=Methylobacterium oxalidis TaxID=944322 RepID=A0A512JDR0_9HYPH|nr:CBS domain-containing protein [Methylobacterium oxalidis]GEP08085.1 inosine-5-monophosphate dehydrogenase [Methylobacterium oxalidis]GJE35114.1 A-adding tRNA nucleotidyltransferase [Methylobacterium oxalidis]GLS64502.1 inosine-5-monophosphate dehydrogenase [Methylobacterium oxalidis]
MTVAHILAEKGASVITVRPGNPLADAIHLLVENGIGALVVMDEAHTVVGIISERDIMHALATHGTSALDLPVSSQMTRKVVTCRRETTNDEVMQLMTEGRFRHMPVCESGKLVGIISIRDVIERQLAVLEAERQAMHDYINMA